MERDAADPRHELALPAFGRVRVARDLSSRCRDADVLLGAIWTRKKAIRLVAMVESCQVRGEREVVCDIALVGERGVALELRETWAATAQCLLRSRV